MRRPDGRFVLALFGAGALSFLAGYAVTELLALIPFLRLVVPKTQEPRP